MLDKCFQNMIDAMTENVAIVDETGLITHVNKSWSEFSTHNEGDIRHTDKGANYFSSVNKAALTGDGFAKKIKTGIEDILAKKITSFELEYPCHSEQQQRWFIANFHEIGNHSPRLFLFTHKDVSSLVLRETNVLEAQRMEAIGQLSGGVAHDFNNLLGILMGNIELAQRKIDEDNPINNYLDNSLIAIRRGAELIQKLLAFAREKNLKQENIDLNTFIHNTFTLINPVLGEDIKIINQLSNESLHIKIDTSMLTSAILNIAINARHAMPMGGTLTIRTSLETLNDSTLLSSEEKVSGTFALISITDTGSGISDEILNKVFEPFFTTKKAGEGSGLGLSMVFGFMMQSNGYIHISSRVDNGTTIFLYLPLVSETADEKKIKLSKTLESLKYKAVLLVEDNNDIREVIAQTLESLGCEVFQNDDGKHALRTLKEHAHKIDIVLSDIIMPSDLSGIELAKEISLRYPKIKLLLMSGYPHKQFINPDSAPLIPILDKPFSLNELAEAIQKL